MTNNPTIDGVSREDERHAAVKTLHDIMQSVPSASLYSLAEAVLDAGYAPAVERQEAVARCRQSPVKKYLSVELLRSDMKDGDLLYSAPPEVAALQSTIARLEARVAELESGRGEPVAWRFRVSSGGDWFTTTKEHVAGLYRGTEDGGEVEPLFTAPPAPVAVVLPSKMRIHDDECPERIYAQAWNACLDATAALNGVKS